MTKFTKIAIFTMILGAGTFFTACNSNDDSDPPAAPTLYEKLGGETMVSDPRNPGQMIEHGRLSYRSVVDTTITLIVADIVADNPGNFGNHFAPLAGEVFGQNNTTTWRD
ncbi:hypothetical protein [Flavobacterium sp. 3HN19-14]|uniref:hypothetical protein n=1 Tax=Flavobacterium sp. 3HN19-14 TaxID=3448133 RepID=UPI003EE22C62